MCEGRGGYIVECVKGVGYIVECVKEEEDI